MKKFYLLALFIGFLGNAQLTNVFQLTSSTKFGIEPSNETNILNGAYFSFANSSTTGITLRKFDGTSVTDVYTFPAYYSGSTAQLMGMPAEINKTENKIYFLLQQAKMKATGVGFEEFTQEMWVSDGTTAGTKSLIKDVRTSSLTKFRWTASIIGRTNSNNNFIGDKLIFGYDGKTMVTDGTMAGTKILTANGVPLTYYRVGGPKLNGKYYFGTTEGICATDGTDSGTELIVDNNVVSVYRDMSDPINGKFLFWGNDAAHGSELWISDGTNAGTKLFLDTVQGTSSGFYNLENCLDMANDGKQIYFVKNISGSGAEIWATDLTLKNTRMVRAVSAYQPIRGKLGNGQIFFKEQNYSEGKLRLSRSDGTLEGTVVLSDGFENKSMAVYQNSLFYDRAEKKIPLYSNQMMDDNIELWKSDGFAENTKMIKDIYPGIKVGSAFNESNSSSPVNFFVLNGFLYFQAKGGTNNNVYKFKGDYTFTGTSGAGKAAANNQWSNPNNWKSGVTPGLQDLVNIPAGYMADVDANAFGKDINAFSPISISVGNLNISGNLNLGAKITLNGNNLNLKGNSSQITNGNSTNYIVTNGTGSVNVENLDNARTVNLPIGTATNYNPVSIANTGTSDTFSARVSEGISNTTNGAVNATWEISEATAGGSNVSLTLGWNTSQQNAAFDSGTAKVGHYLNGNWTEENSGTVSNNSITATGISTFSPFAVMNFGTLAATDFSKSKVSVYPNPFNENLNISTENAGVVHFYDLSGKLVSTSVLMKGTNSLNKSSLAKGVYIYQIRNTIGEILSSGKMIKK